MIRLSFLLVLALACGDSVPEDEAICTSDELLLALSAARAEETVTVGACEITGSFAVPVSVTLAGTEGSVLRGTGDVVTLVNGASLRGLDVVVTGGRGVVLGASSSVVDVGITVDGGIGVYADGVTSTLTRVQVQGALDPSDPDSIPAMADETTGHVLASLQDAQTTFTEVSVSRGGPRGVVVQGGTLRWTRGGMEDVVGVGLLLEDAEADLFDLNVSRLYAGVQPHPAYGVIARGSRLSTTNLTLSESEGMGLLAIDATGEHTGLTASACALGGVWLDASDLSFTNATLRANGLVGVVAGEGASLSMTDSLVETTTMQLAAAGIDPTLEAGDGIQLDGAASVTLENVELADNARVGLLIDETGATTTMMLTSVDIHGGGLGAIAQDGATVMPLDSPEVTRTPDLVMRDDAVTSPLDLTSELDPAAVP